jgi:hypothetical protein
MNGVMLGFREFARGHLVGGVVVGSYAIIAGAPRSALAVEAVRSDLVQVAGDVLTVRLVDVPLDDVLDEIGRQSDAEIRGKTLGERRVTVSFDDVPLAQALARLLAGQNFALVYDKEGRLAAVQVLGGTHPIVRKPPRNPGWSEAIRDLLARQPPVAVSGALAEALGAESATFAQLLDLGLRHDDDRVRAEAVRAGLGAVQSDPELRRAVLENLKGVDNGTLTAMLQNSTPYAEQVAGAAAEAVTVPEARLKVTSILQRMKMRD